MSYKLKLTVAALAIASSMGAYAAAPEAVEVVAPVANDNVVVCPRGFEVPQECLRYAEDYTGPRGFENAVQGPRGFGPADRAYAQGPRGPQGPHAQGPRGPQEQLQRGPHHGLNIMGGDDFSRAPQGNSYDALKYHQGLMLQGWCPEHQMRLSGCLGKEMEAKFGNDFKQLAALEDQLFVKRQVLKAQVNAGAEPAVITKYATEVNVAKAAYRAAAAQLKSKIHTLAREHVKIDAKVAAAAQGAAPAAEGMQEPRTLPAQIKSVVRSAMQSAPQAK